MIMWHRFKFVQDQCPELTSNPASEPANDYCSSNWIVPVPDLISGLLSVTFYCTFFTGIDSGLLYRYWICKWFMCVHQTHYRLWLVWFVTRMRRKPETKEINLLAVTKLNVIDLSHFQIINLIMKALDWK